MIGTKMTLGKVRRMIQRWVYAKAQGDKLPALLLLGPKGIGKSTVVLETGKDLGCDVKIINVAHRDKVDWMGLPYTEPLVNSTNITKWAPPHSLVRQDKQLILFLDEITNAEYDELRPVIQLLTEGFVGDYYIAKDTVIIAAGNPPSESQLANELPDVLLTRFFVIEVIVDFEEWRRWAIGKGLRPEVIAFVEAYREFFIEKTRPEPYANPRSWEYVSNILDVVDPKDITEDFFVGLVGKNAGPAFYKFFTTSIVDPKEILANPSKWKQLESGKKYYVVFKMVDIALKRPSEYEKLGFGSSDEFLLYIFRNFSSLMEKHFRAIFIKGIWEEKIEFLSKLAMSGRREKAFAFIEDIVHVLERAMNPF